ncbi:hypothetical protein V6N13_018902 [Hibiscus sabdariffa]|uniref:Uncharacterized protein n=1 Tax=Hibiscus sabdariffa TaxID=183260 RepID=A0ABR2EKI6_9ROSI
MEITTWRLNEGSENVGKWCKYGDGVDQKGGNKGRRLNEGSENVGKWCKYGDGVDQKGGNKGRRLIWELDFRGCGEMIVLGYRFLMRTRARQLGDGLHGG